MIAAHLEPKGLAPDAKPLAAFMEAGSTRADAVRGSQRLLRAILRLQRPRRKPNRTGAKTWRERKLARERTQRIIAVAADYFEISVDELLGQRGSSELSRRRQTAMYVARNVAGASYPDLGYCFRRDHTTVLHACRVVERDPVALWHATILRERLAA